MTYSPPRVEYVELYILSKIELVYRLVVAFILETSYPTVVETVLTDNNKDEREDETDEILLRISGIVDAVRYIPATLNACCGVMYISSLITVLLPGIIGIIYDKILSIDCGLIYIV